MSTFLYSVSGATNSTSLDYFFPIETFSLLQVFFFFFLLSGQHRNCCQNKYLSLFTTCWTQAFPVLLMMETDALDLAKNMSLGSQ